MKISGDSKLESRSLWSHLQRFWGLSYPVAKNTITYMYMGVSENGGTPKSSILIGFSIINHPSWGTPVFGNTHVYLLKFHFRGQGPLSWGKNMFAGPTYFSALDTGYCIMMHADSCTEHAVKIVLQRVGSIPWMTACSKQVWWKMLLHPSTLD